MQLRTHLTIITESNHNGYSCLSATADHEFYCLGDNSTNETTTELQFCDGNLDCIDGSDEPSKCPTGTVLSMN